MDDIEGSAPSGEETLDEYQGDEGKWQRWRKEIDYVLNHDSQKAFESVGERLVAKYKAAESMVPTAAGESMSPRQMFNVLWANVQVLRPTYFARLPKAVVERRHKDKSGPGRMAAMLGERCVNAMVDLQKSRALWAFKMAVLDLLLPGRGQVRLRYQASFEDAPDEAGDPLSEEQAEPDQWVTPNSERVFIDPMIWTDYLEALARNPFEQRWRAYKCYMNRAELKKRFGEKGERVKLTHIAGEEIQGKLTGERKDWLAQALVWEIEDKQNRERVWISDGLKNECLDCQPDQFNVEGFWTTPDPLLATITSDSMYPTPDGKIYERLADELDCVTKRISKIADMVRVVGMHAAALGKDIKNMMKLQDGNTHPVSNWAQFMEGKGGIKGAINWFPFDRAVAALEPLMGYQRSLLSQIFEITGIPDIVRGASDARETAAAQQLKGHWTTVKTETRQGEVQQFCCETYSKMCQIIFEPGLFADETIWMLAGVGQMSPENQQWFGPGLQLMRDDRMMSFTVNIETDSTIALDEATNLENWSKYISAITQITAQIEQVVSFRPELMHPMIESAKAAVRQFRTGRTTEEAWENSWEEIETAMKQPPSPPPPDPMLMIEQGKLQNQAQEIGIKGQAAQAEAQYKMGTLQIEQQKVQSKQYMDQVEAQLNQWQEQFNQHIEQARLEMDKELGLLKVHEQLIEEGRLKQEGLAKVVESIQAVPPAPAPPAQSSGGPVNINFDKVIMDNVQLDQRRKRKIAKVRRTPEGLEGEVIELPEEEIVGGQ